MMESSLSEPLREAVDEVLETMFFVEDGGRSAVGRPPEELIEARLSFEGGPSGSFRLRITDGAANALAADFLGEDAPELTAARIAEVIAELANMICGGFLSRVAGEATTFRLSVPSAVTVTGGVVEAQEDGLAYRVELPDGALGVALRVDGDGS